MFFTHIAGRQKEGAAADVHRLRTSSGQSLPKLPFEANTYEGMEVGWPFMVTKIDLPDSLRLILDTRKLDRSRLLRTTALVERFEEGARVHVHGRDFYRSLVSYRVVSHAPRWVHEQHADQLCKLDALLSDIAGHYSRKLLIQGSEWGRSSQMPSSTASVQALPWSDPTVLI